MSKENGNVMSANNQQQLPLAVRFEILKETPVTYGHIINGAKNAVIGYAVYHAASMVVEQATGGATYLPRLGGRSLPAPDAAPGAVIPMKAAGSR